VVFPLIQHFSPYWAVSNSSVKFTVFTLCEHTSFIFGTFLSMDQLDCHSANQRDNYINYTCWPWISVRLALISCSVGHKLIPPYWSSCAPWNVPRSTPDQRVSLRLRRFRVL
jgi:hypothetical protein